MKLTKQDYARRFTWLKGQCRFLNCDTPYIRDVKLTKEGEEKRQALIKAHEEFADVVLSDGYYEKCRDEVFQT